MGGGTGGLCHPHAGLSQTLFQTEDCEQSSVLPGSYTWFDADKADDLTYAAFEEANPANCFAWGHDPGYYADLGCYRLP